MSSVGETSKDIGPRTPLTKSQEPVILRVAHYLAGLAKEKFYGKVTITMEEGVVQIVRQEQTIKPDELG